MPTSATGTSRAGRGRRGFTLVELLVVVVILSVAASAVVLSLPDPVPPVLSEAERLTARLQLAREEAILTNRPVSVRLSPQGYEFQAFDGEAWQGLDGPLRARAWPERLEVQSQARVSFDPSGLADLSELLLTRDGHRVLIRIDGAGEVSLAQ